MGKKQKTDPAKELENSFLRWDYLLEHGGSDPFYADGTNMNLVRNHIIYGKRQIEEACGSETGKYPDIYFRELPPEVNAGYMVNSGEIRDKAREALDIYLTDANFQYLIMNQEFLAKKEAEKISIHNVIGYVESLAAALKGDDLITMRRHARGSQGYQESFAGCAEKMKELFIKRQEESKESGQLTLFQSGIQKGQCR